MSIGLRIGTRAAPKVGLRMGADSSDAVAQTTLSVVLADSADPVLGGANYAYTAVVTNTDVADATTVSCVIVCPSSTTFVSASGTGWTCNNVGHTVTCTRNTLAAGAAPTITVTVTSANADATLSATADADADNAPAATQDTEATTVVGQTTLTVVLADSADPVITAEAYSYTAVVTNTGANSATNVTALVTLDAQSAFVSASGTGWACNHSGGVVTCTRAAGAVGALPTITVNVTAAVAAETSSASADADSDNSPAATQDVETTVIKLVAKDATSGIYVPADATQWADFITCKGLTISAPNSLWLLQEASGNAADSIGSLTLTATGTPSYEQPATGWTRLGVGFTDNATQHFSVAAASGPNPTTTSSFWLCSVVIRTEPTAARTILGPGRITSSTDEIRLMASPSAGTNRLGMRCDAVVTNGVSDHAAGTHFFGCKYDRANSIVVGYSELEKHSGTYSAAILDGTKGFGGVVAMDAVYVYACMWSGAAAEAMTDANVKALQVARGFSIPWS